MNLPFNPASFPVQKELVGAPVFLVVHLVRFAVLIEFENPSIRETPPAGVVFDVLNFGGVLRQRVYAFRALSIRKVVEMPGVRRMNSNEISWSSNHDR